MSTVCCVDAAGLCPVAVRGVRGNTADQDDARHANRQAKAALRTVAVVMVGEDAG